MTANVLLTALSKAEVVHAYADACERHTLVGCLIAGRPGRISWVAYRTELGTIARLTYYP